MKDCPAVLTVEVGRLGMCSSLLIEAWPPLKHSVTTIVLASSRVLWLYGLNAPICKKQGGGWLHA